MKVDVESLGTFSRTAHEGAERAAENLTGMTGIETAVDVTRVTLASADDLAGERGRRVGVTVDFEGGIAGTSLLTFPPEEIETHLDALVPGAGGDESAVSEVGNIVTSGFLDGWADCLGTTIDISPPEYVEGTGPQLLAATEFDRDRAFVFRSRASAVGEQLDFAFRMFPDRESMDEMLSGDDGIPVEKLATLREMARTGARTASETVSQMTGIETRVDISHLSFVPVEDVPAGLSDRRHVGVVLEFESTLGGYVLILFDEASAREVVAALVTGETSPPSNQPPTDDADETRSSSSATESRDGATVETFDGVERSAIEEIGNVMTSSFVDGWANVLDTTIEISPPRFVHDMGRAVAESVVARLGQRQANAVLFDATLRAADRKFDCEIYALPDETELRTVLAELEPGETGERTTRAGPL